MLHSYTVDTATGSNSGLHILLKDKSTRAGIEPPWLKDGPANHWPTVASFHTALLPFLETFLFHLLPLQAPLLYTTFHHDSASLFGSAYEPRGQHHIGATARLPPSDRCVAVSEFLFPVTGIIAVAKTRKLHLLQHVIYPSPLSSPSWNFSSKKSLDSWKTTFQCDTNPSQFFAQHESSPFHDSPHLYIGS